MSCFWRFHCMCVCVFPHAEERAYWKRRSFLCCSRSSPLPTSPCTINFIFGVLSRGSLAKAAWQKNGPKPRGPVWELISLTRSLTNDLPGFPSVGCCHSTLNIWGFEEKACFEHHADWSNSKQQGEQRQGTGDVFEALEKECRCSHLKSWALFKGNHRPRVINPSDGQLTQASVFPQSRIYLFWLTSKTLDATDALSGTQEINQSNDWTIISSAIN